MFRPFNPDYLPRNWKQLDELEVELNEVKEKMRYLECIRRTGAKNHLAEWSADEEREYANLEEKQKEIKLSLEIANEGR
jgi:hypothetical protein